MALPKDRNQDTSYQRAVRIRGSSRTPSEQLLAKQQLKLAKLEERLSTLMSLRAFEEEVLAELMRMEPKASQTSQTSQEDA